jgi:hypothetical protein
MNIIPEKGFPSSKIQTTYNSGWNYLEQSKKFTGWLEQAAILLVHI